MKNKQTFLGIELGSTRIKSVLIDENHSIIASSSYNWENQLIDGVWTYSLDLVWRGIQSSVLELAKKDQDDLRAVSGIGVSAMMHGYLVFDIKENLLVPFRTWRNTTTKDAAEILSEEFQYNIPQRWSIAHLYQSILNKEEHLKEISFLTTLAGYVHWQLSGEKVLGVGDASGVFPIDNSLNIYNKKMIDKFEKIISQDQVDISLEKIFPKILSAGENAGKLTEKGALLLDPSKTLRAGIPLCPPEGDAGAGMVATNSVKMHTGNVSAGTSVFSMVVLERNLTNVYTEIDMVATPTGLPVAMVHCNNFISEIDSWAALFTEVAELFGAKPDVSTLYNKLYNKALEADEDLGNILSYNYFSGEPITSLEEGRPLLVRSPNSNFTLANMMKNLIFSAIATLKIGMDILTKKEKVEIDKLLGHGGFFKVQGVGQLILASALEIPVEVMDSAGEGGAWGISVLAAFSQLNKKNLTLEDYLENIVFINKKGSTLLPVTTETKSFNDYLKLYKKGLAIEKSAVENFII